MVMWENVPVFRWLMFHAELINDEVSQYLQLILKWFIKECEKRETERDWEKGRGQVIVREKKGENE